VKLPWQNSPATIGVTKPPTSAAKSTHACPTLERALKAVFRVDKPDVLDLGPMCGASVIYLADMGARVTVSEPEIHVPAKPIDGDDESPVTRPFRIDQADEKFHLVLAWEQCDFIPEQHLQEFGAELHRVLRPGGWLLLFSLNCKQPEPGRPSRYRIISNDRVSREPVAGSPRQRWLYPTRTIERALAPMSVQTLHLQRNQMREFLSLKPLATGSSKTE